MGDVRASLRYRTIVADPPWPIGAFPKWADAAGTTATPYPTMSLDEIAALPVATFAEPEAHLYLWAINEYLVDAHAVAKAWGFQPSATLVWCKPPRGRGFGGVYASNVEFVLFCRARQTGNSATQRLGAWLRSQRLASGLTAKALCAEIGAHAGVNHGGAVANWEAGLHPPTEQFWAKLKQALSFGDQMDATFEAVRAMEPWSGKQCDTRWFTWPRGRHSEKPEAFLDLVEQVSPGPYVELFARRDRLGWDTWGNESLGTAWPTP